MRKVIYLDSDNSFSGDTYRDFIDYAFARSDFFMLAYVNYYGKGYSKRQKEFRKLLEKFQIKSRSTPSWPGTPFTQSKNTTYKVVFYKNTDEAKEILKQVSSLWDWSRPSFPEDLAFFIGNHCWFYSVCHENIAAIIRADDVDLDFVTEKGLTSPQSAFYSQDPFFDLCDEQLSDSKS